MSARRQCETGGANAKSLLQDAGLAPTPNRTVVVETLARSRTTLSAPEILDRLPASRPMNRVTLYRILGLLVNKQVVFRHSAGDRAYRYCLGQRAEGPSHVHFYCTTCNAMECLSREEAPVDLDRLRRTVGRRVENVELRLDGICAACAAKAKQGSAEDDGCQSKAPLIPS